MLHYFLGVCPTIPTTSKCKDFEFIFSLLLTDISSSNFIFSFKMFICHYIKKKNNFFIFSLFYIFLGKIIIIRLYNEWYFFISTRFVRVNIRHAFDVLPCVLLAGV